MTIFMKISESQKIIKNGKKIKDTSMSANYDGHNANVIVSDNGHKKFTKISKDDWPKLLALKSNQKGIMNELLENSNDAHGIHRRHRHHVAHKKHHKTKRKHHTKRHTKRHAMRHTKKPHTKRRIKHYRHTKKLTKKRKKLLKSKIKKLLKELF